MSSDSSSPVLPVLIATLGIGTYSMMDVLMKGLSIDIGAYNAVLWRNVAGTILTGIAFFAMRKRWPARAAVRIHLIRSLFVAGMALSFFWGLARLPMAEAIALSFIAPLITLYMAALFLGEQISSRSITASLLGLAGMIVIVGGRIGSEDHSLEALLAAGAIFLSALLYAYNLILARRQAQMAKPLEIAFFQNLFVAMVMMLFAPWWATIPLPGHSPALLGAAGLAVVSLLMLSWAYARAEAQILVTVEYSAFIWAALFGWLFFAEHVTIPTLAGAGLIVIACLMVARKKPPAVPIEAAAA